MRSGNVATNWPCGSANACLLIEDPAAAIEAATAATDLDSDTMRELESVLMSLAQKLDLPTTIRIETDLSKAC